MERFERKVRPYSTKKMILNPIPSLTTFLDQTQIVLLFGKRGIFPLGLQKNEFEYAEYCEFLYSYFVGFGRRMAAAKPSQVTPQHCQDAVRSIVGILDGLTYLCKYDNDGKVQEFIGKIFYPLFILICAMTRYIKTVPLAQKLDKGLMELSAEFLVRLKKCWKAKDFAHIQVVLKSPKLSQYRNLMTIYLTLRPIEMLIEPELEKL